RRPGEGAGDRAGDHPGRRADRQPRLHDWHRDPVPAVGFLRSPGTDHRAGHPRRPCGGLRGPRVRRSRRCAARRGRPGAAIRSPGGRPDWAAGGARPLGADGLEPMRLSALAWRGLLARPLRTALTILGVALGVGIITATLVANQAATETVQRAAQELYGKATIRVRAFSDAGLTPRAVTTLRQLPDVAAAAAVSERRLVMSTLPGPYEQVYNLLAIGVDPDDEQKVRQPTLVAGSYLTAGRPNEVVLNAHWADDHGLKVGDALLLTGDLRKGPPHMQIVGLLDDVGFGALGSGAVAVIPRSTLATAFAGSGATTGG